jgi:hypothetical protein
VVGSHTINKKQLKKAAIITGSAMGVAAIAVGSVFAARYLGSSGSLSAANATVGAPVKKFAQSMAEEPIGIVHAARGKHHGFTFPGRGGLTDPLIEYDKAGFHTLQDAKGAAFKRYGDRLEKIAAKYPDPAGRLDRSGRGIFHEVMLPESMAKMVNNVDDVVDVTWPLIKDKYDALYDLMPGVRLS